MALQSNYTVYQKLAAESIRKVKEFPIRMKKIFLTIKFVELQLPAMIELNNCGR